MNSQSKIAFDSTRQPDTPRPCGKSTEASSPSSILSRSNNGDRQQPLNQMVTGWGLDLALETWHRVAAETVKLAQAIAGALG